MSNQIENTKVQAGLSLLPARNDNHINQMQQTEGRIVLLHPYKVTV